MPYLAFGVTNALNLKTVCFGQVFAVTVTVLLLAFGFPLLSNFTSTLHSPPTGIGVLVQLGAVQPQEGRTLSIIRGDSPVFLNVYV